MHISEQESFISGQYLNLKDPADVVLFRTSASKQHNWLKNTKDHSAENMAMAG